MPWMLNPYRVSLTLLLSFCEGSQTLAEMVCVVFPFYLWDTPWRFITITCTDSPFFDGISLGDPWVSYSFNCCYFGSLSAWYFYIFPAFYCFPSWKTSIGGNVWAPEWHFTLRYMFCVLYSYPPHVARFLRQGLPVCPRASQTLKPKATRLLLLLQASKSPKVEHPVDCVVTSFVQNPIHNPVVSRTTACSDSHSRWDT